MAASASTATTTFDVHRCRFVDYVPAAITAIAVPPAPLPRVQSTQKAAAPPSTNVTSRFPPIAVGRGDGNIELYEWSGVGQTAQASPQAWILHKILYAPAPSKVDTLVWTLRDPSLLRAGQAPTLADLRLFSAGGGNELLEWNLDSGTIARSLSSQGGSIWSMSANPASTVLALGCEDGSIRLVSVAEDALEHKRKFDRVKTRLLSLAWGPPRPPAPRKPSTTKPGVTASEDSDDSDDEDEEWSDSWILAGCSDSTLRKWDYASGRVLDRMLVDRRKGERTLVWAVAVLGDGTMVSGDSLGNVRFWDAATCTQLQSYQLHGADVLCLTVGPEGRSIYSAGVDQKICQYSRVEVASGDEASLRWIHSATQRYHVHDVRALATWPTYTPLPSSVTIPAPSGRVISSLLFSGGLDVNLNIKPCMLPLERSASQPTRILNPIKTSSLSTFADSWQLRRNYPSRGLVLRARDARLLMLVRNRGVSVWRLSKLQNNSDDSDELGLQALLHDPEATDGGWAKVLDMQLNVATNLCCGAISDDGQWLAVADMYETKLFRLDHKGEVTKPRRVKNLTSKLLPHVASGSEDEISTGSTALTFSPDSSKLVLATSLSSYTLIIDLAGAHDDLDNIHVLRRFDQHRLRDVAQPSSSAAPRQVNGHAQKHGDVAMDVDQAPSDEESDGAIAHQKIRLADSYETQIRRITQASFSPDGQWLATSDEHRRVHVYNMDSIQHHCVLPVFESDVVALLFDPARTHNLVVVLATNRIRVFDVEARTFPIWARALCDTIPAQVTNRRESVVGACFTRTRSRAGAPAPALVLWATDWFCHIRLDADVPMPAPSRQTKRTRDGLAADAANADDQSDDEIIPQETDTAIGTTIQPQPQQLRTFILSDTHYRPVLFMGFFGDGDLVVVERPHADIMAGLAPAFYKQRYGAS